MMGNLLLGIWRDVLGSLRTFSLSDLSDTLADAPYGAFAQLGLARVPNTLAGAKGRVEKVWVGCMDEAGWNTMFAYFGARQEMASPLRSQVGADPTDCGAEQSQTSARR
jgi:hypothetical protein